MKEFMKRYGWIIVGYISVISIDRNNPKWLAIDTLIYSFGVLWIDLVSPIIREAKKHLSLDEGVNK